MFKAGDTLPENVNICKLGTVAASDCTLFQLVQHRQWLSSLNSVAQPYHVVKKTF